MKHLFILIFSVCLACSAQQTKPPEVVKNVDLNKYTGKWYEIATFPQRFQKGCSCTTAEYTKNKSGYIEVYNACDKNGKESSIHGKAFIVPNSNNAKLKVEFFWPFKADYWIIDLADDYSYAVVSGESRSYLWILCRKPVMDENLYNSIIKKLKDQGFDTSHLVKTMQNCN